MFLDIVEKRNPELLKAAITLHKSGEIAPDTYVLDLDRVLENGRLLLKEAEARGIKLYAMTKQFGRVPIVTKKLIEMGFSGVVAVDFKEAQTMIDNKIKLGNVGHLVQIPSSMVENIVASNPEIITVYSIEKIRDIDKASKKFGKVQNIMVRVLEKESKIYPGQKGGFYLEELEGLVEATKELKNIKIDGITSFPCFLYDSEKNSLEKTENVDTIQKANKILKKLGIEVEQINLPSGTSLENIKRIAEMGGTHGEPGHSLTGTTPYNIKNEGGETPAIIYLSEISHNLDSTSFCYGGGHYRRSGMKNALVGDRLEEMKRVGIEAPSMENIDYYFEIDSNEKVGATVIAAFRTQVFVTRSDVAVVEGISKGKPKLIGIFDSFGREKNEKRD